MSTKQELGWRYAGGMLSDGSIDIADPACKESSGGRVRLGNVWAGPYACFVKRQDEGDFGIRNARIMIVSLAALHGTAGAMLAARELDSGRGEDLGSVFVDSGQAGFFNTKSFDFNEDGRYDDESKFYGKCCKATLSGARFGTIGGAGFVSESGHGDGKYALYGIRAGGKIAALMLEFI